MPCGAAGAGSKAIPITNSETINRRLVAFVILSNGVPPTRCGAMRYPILIEARATAKNAGEARNARAFRGGRLSSVFQTYGVGLG